MREQTSLLAGQHRGTLSFLFRECLHPCLCFFISSVFYYQVYHNISITFIFFGTKTSALHWKALTFAGPITTAASPGADPFPLLPGKH